jgi:general secretion pathway protein K
MRKNATQPKPNGFILIVVLGAVLTMSVLLFGFRRVVQAKLAVVGGFCETEQAWNCARAGLNVAISAVRSNADVWCDDRCAKLVAGEDPIAVADGTCSITIAEEDGLLNVNCLKRETGELDRAHIDQLLRLIDLLNRENIDAPRIGYGIVPAIIDWTDHDGDVTYLPFIKHENTGAETDYYSTLDRPGRCRNEPVDVLDELLPVKGMTPETLARLQESLTTFGDGKVNINAAPKRVLQSLCEQISPALAEMIVRQRRLKPFANIAELKDVPGMTDNIYYAIRDTITVGGKDRFYHVRSRGTVGGLTVTIEAVLQRNTRAGNVDTVQYREL